LLILDVYGTNNELLLFLTLFSSNVSFRVIFSPSIIVHMLKVIKIKHFRYNELKKGNEPCILSTGITHGTQMCLAIRKMTIFSGKFEFLAKIECKNSKISLGEVRRILI
jgi:hypothetical protein